MLHHDWSCISRAFPSNLAQPYFSKYVRSDQLSPPSAPQILHGGSTTNIYSLGNVTEPPFQGDRDESETTKECKEDREREVVNPLIGTI